MQTCAGDFCEEVTEATMEEDGCRLRFDTNVEESVTRSLSIVVEGAIEQNAPHV